MSPSLRRLAAYLLVPSALVIAGAVDLRFVQDDAYITMTYGRNLADGIGAVFVKGEAVEGFTSILWMLLSAMLSTITSDPAQALQTLGIAAAVATVVLVGLLTWHVLDGVDGIDDRRRPLLAAAAALWPASTAAFQFWSASAMETSFFLASLVLTVLLWFRRPNGFGWLIGGVVLLLTRPEALLVLPVLLAGTAIRPSGLRVAVHHGAVLAAAVGGLTLWRWLTFGALLPNTFAAKTSSLATQAGYGVDYLLAFTTEVGGFGIALLAVVVAGVLANRSDIRTMATLVVLWTAAVVVLGGDVLRHQRFLLPIQVLAAPLVVYGIATLVARRSVPLAPIVAGVACAALAVQGWFSERTAIQATIAIERELVNKMAITGRFLAWVSEREGRPLTVAASTIGSLAWHSRQNVVDMLGLTDRTIATMPAPIAALESDASIVWKERKYNAAYVLSRQPDYIVFSTGIKPSAFAERALLLEQFYVDYYQYYYHAPGDTKLLQMFRRKPSAVLARSPQHRIDLTDAHVRAFRSYVDGLAWLTRPDAADRARALFSQVVREGAPNFSGAWQQLADLGNPQVDTTVRRLYLQAITIDPCDIRAHFSLYQLARMDNDTAAMRLHGDWVGRCNPQLFTMAGLPVPDDAY